MLAGPALEGGELLGQESRHRVISGGLRGQTRPRLHG